MTLDRETRAIKYDILDNQSDKMLQKQIITEPCNLMVYGESNFVNFWMVVKMRSFLFIWLHSVSIEYYFFYKYIQIFKNCCTMFKYIIIISCIIRWSHFFKTSYLITIPIFSNFFLQIFHFFKYRFSYFTKINGWIYSYSYWIQSWHIEYINIRIRCKM